MNPTQLNITGIKALKDNYIWMIGKNDNDQVVIVDPGEEEPVIAVLEKLNVKLSGILITHHHWDHTNGAAGLQAKYDIPVFWSKDRYAGEEIILPGLKLQFRILSIPGHTLDHVAYYGHGALFCGDTLFTGGCGRIFEGTALQMYRSLAAIVNLPDDTQIYCGHEYTQANLKFAKMIEPENTDLLKRIHQTDSLREQGLPTVPALLSAEKKTNPFLRCRIKSVIEAVENHVSEKISDPAKIFECLRNWKNAL
jgi:hydroxyacylglutathione hydrolase